MMQPKPTSFIIVVLLTGLAMATACQSDSSAGTLNTGPTTAPMAQPTSASPAESLGAAQKAKVSKSPTSEPEPTETAAPSAANIKVVVDYETWDLAAKDAWEGPIGAKFATAHPGIGLSYLVTSGAEYNNEVLERFERGTAADLVACRPFTGSEKLYDAGYLAPLDDIDNGVLSESDFVAWTGEDGSHYCIPVTAVMQGFIYNADIFTELDLEPPTTLDEFHTTLEAIADDGRYVPLAIGLADPWQMGDLGFNIIGPTFWEGEAGRQRLFTGEIDFTDERFVDLFAEIQSWRPYLPEEAEFVDGQGATDLFVTGQAAIYPAGSWYLSSLEDTDFSVRAFPPPRRDASAPCYVLDQPDLGIGLNATSSHPTESKVFLQWLTTQEFADVAAENLVGRFPMADTAPGNPDPAAAQFNEWRSECVISMRLGTDIPRSDTFSERDAWDLVGEVVTGQISPEVASQRLQKGFGPNLETAES